MPRYTASKKGELQAKGNKSFTSPDELIHFLCSATDKEWKPFKQVAIDYLAGKHVPTRRLKKTKVHQVATLKPFDLVRHVHDEFDSHNGSEESQLGGGIAEVIHTAGSLVSHTLGLDRIGELFGLGPKKNPRTIQSQRVAYLTDLTYKKPKDRPAQTVGYTRIQKYDSDLVSVWEDSNGELLVCVRGSKINFDDIGKDLKILFGQAGQKSDPLDKLLDQIEKDYPNKKYDVGGHSLGTAFVLSEFEEHRDNMGSVYLYNAASSPLQNVETLQGYANSDAMFYINQGDMVSNAMYQQFDRDHLENNVFIGPYSYTPWGSHSLSQWYNDRNIEYLENKANRSAEHDREDYERLEADAQLSTDTKESQTANLS